MKLTALAFTLVYLSVIRLSAQPGAVRVYEAKVVTNEGRRIRGILDDVSTSRLFLNDVDRQAYRYRRGDAIVDLNDVKKISIRRHSRQPTLTGAVIGGLATGYFTVRSTRKYGFRSPVLGGFNLALGAAAGAAVGALLGNKIGSTTRRTIRPVGQTPDEAAENLRRQLEPFTYSHQMDVLNRVPQ